jgi:hypothetical protein
MFFVFFDAIKAEHDVTDFSGLILRENLRHDPAVVREMNFGSVLVFQHKAFEFHFGPVA